MGSSRRWGRWSSTTAAVVAASSASSKARARAPDGYTLLLGSNSTHILVPLIAKQAGFDPIKDFELATVFSITSTAIAVHPGSPTGR